MASFFRSILYSHTEQANYMLFSTKNPQTVRNMFKDILMECYSCDSYSNTCATSRIYLLFALLLRRFGHTIQFYDMEKSLGDHHNFTHILMYIQKNFASLTLHSLAEKFNYNPSYLSTMIKKNTGRNLTDIVTQLKMSKASDLLKHTDFKITEIASLVGYDSTDHFSRQFKRNYHMSPSCYARLYKKTDHSGSPSV